jgi:nucleotide-binding universal stress UspA family protein
MPTRRYNGYQRILVLLDGSRRAAWAVNLVSSIARSKGTELILLQVVEPPDMPRNRPFTSEETVLRNRLIESNRQAAACYLEEVKKQYSGTVEIRERLEISPHVVKTIEQVAASEDVDLIALTAHGASDITGRISGAVCQSLVLLASRPVLIVQDNPRRNHNRSRETTDGKIEMRMERNVGVG